MTQKIAKNDRDRVHYEDALKQLGFCVRTATTGPRKEAMIRKAGLRIHSMVPHGRGNIYYVKRKSLNQALAKRAADELAVQNIITAFERQATEVQDDVSQIDVAQPSMFDVHLIEDEGTEGSLASQFAAIENRLFALIHELRDLRRQSSGEVV